MPSLCTPSALRKPSFCSGALSLLCLAEASRHHLLLFPFSFLAGDIFARPLCLRHFRALPPLPSRAPVSLRGELLGVAGALVFASGGPVFVVAAQGTPWEARGACVPPSHGTVPSEPVLGRPAPPGAAQTAVPPPPPSSCERG